MTRLAAALVIAGAGIHGSAAGAAGAPSARADIALSVTTTPQEPTTLEPLTYAVVVSNKGPHTAPSAGFQVSLPYEPIEVLSSEGTTCSRVQERRVRCDAGELLKGAAATVQVSVQPTVAGTVTSSFSGWGGVADPDESNDELTVKTYVRWGGGLPASCSGTVAPVGGSVWCGQGFTLTQPTTVTLALQPGAGFSGALSASIQGAPDATVEATYLAGETTAGQESTQLTLPAGDFRLVARVGGPLFTTPPDICLNLVGYCGPPWTINLPGISTYAAAGTFGATVVGSSSGSASS